MQQKNSSICIVASTLPAGFIASQIKEMGIKKIIVSSNNLELSFNVIKERHPEIRIVCIPTGFLKQTMYLFTQLFGARLRGDKVVFFHECCMPLLDLLLILIRPRGFYFPHSTLSEWKDIGFQKFPKGRITRIIKILGLVNKFNFYSSPGVGNNNTEFIIALKKYPNSIISNEALFVRKLLAQKIKRKDDASKSILFITSKSFVSDSIQIDLYLKMLEISFNSGYSCYIKDHPNPIYRLNINFKNAIYYESLMPSELIEQEFSYVVGVSSTALLNFGSRSISLVNLLPSMSRANRDACVKAFDVLTVPGNGIKYIESINEFQKLLYRI